VVLTKETILTLRFPTHDGDLRIRRLPVTTDMFLSQCKEIKCTHTVYTPNLKLKMVSSRIVPE